MSIIEIARIQIRRGKEGTTGIPQLSPGEFGWAQDTENLYIGKRIAEGANTDENSRILSQKDYDNLFAIVMGAGRTAVASTSTYRYRDNLDYPIFRSTTTFIGAKLDAFVSLTDFPDTVEGTPKKLEIGSTGTDITNFLKEAIKILYQNVSIEKDTQRKLLIPGGVYYLSDTVELPPNTSLVGEGVGMTVILAQKNDRPLFKTVDKEGRDFNNILMNSSKDSSKNVLLKGMTLAYTTSTPTLTPLVFFDNTEKSKIENIEFTIVSTGTETVTNGTTTITNIIITATSTLSNFGIGLSLRGTYREGIESNKEVEIVDCKFHNLNLAVLATGSVAYSKFENNVFSNLVQGISFLPETSITQISPTKSTITKNNFFDIEQQAIFVGTSTNLQTQQPNILNHSSSFNHFYRVGNGKDLNGYPDGDGIVSNTGTAVISCFGEGFVSINDKFSRKDYANPNFFDPLYPKPANFFYKPLVEGNVFLDSGSSSKIRDLFIQQNRTLERLYTSDEPVTYKISYTLHDTNAGINWYNRAGLLTINVVGNSNYSNSPEGSISDYYDYSYDEDWPIVDSATDPLTGDLIQPIFSLESSNSNNSYLNLSYSWPISLPSVTTIFKATITNIVSVGVDTIVTTRSNHNLTTATSVYLTNVEGISDYFKNEADQQYYVSVIDDTSFSLYFDQFLITSVDTSGKSPFISTSTKFTTSTVTITNVTAASPVVVTTENNHNLISKNYVRFSSTNTNTILSVLNTASVFVNPLTPTTFALFKNEDLTDPYEGTSFTDFTGNTAASLLLNAMPSVVIYSYPSSLQFQYQTNIIV